MTAHRIKKKKQSSIKEYELLEFNPLFLENDIFKASERKKGKCIFQELLPNANGNKSFNELFP